MYLVPDSYHHLDGLCTIVQLNHIAQSTIPNLGSVIYLLDLTLSAANQKQCTYGTQNGHPYCTLCDNRSPALHEHFNVYGNL